MADTKNLGFTTNGWLPAKSVPAIAKITFILTGCTSLIHWNFLVFTLPYVQKLFLDDTDYTSSYLGLFQLANALSQFVMLKTGSRFPMVLIICSFLLAIFGFIIGYFFVHPPTTQGAIIAIHVFILIFGLADGFIQGISFSLGAVMPENLVGSVSIGQGLVGLFCFVVATILSFGAFDLETRIGVRNFIWTTLSIAAFVTILVSFLLFVILYHPWAKEKLLAINDKHDIETDNSKDISGNKDTNDEDKQTIIDNNNDNNKKTTSASDLVQFEESRGLKYILKDSGLMMALAFIHFFVSFHLYPKVGPFSWNYNQKIKNHLIILCGLFCVFEFIGRSMPDLSNIKYMGWTKIPLKLFTFLELFRILMFVPFLLSYFLKNTVIVNDFWFHCIIIIAHSLTQGWFGTLCFVYGTSSLVRLKEREIAAPLTVIAVILGCTVGLFLGLPYKSTE